jgi:hypothetical protein
MFEKICIYKFISYCKLKLNIVCYDYPTGKDELKYACIVYPGTLSL